MEVLLLGTLTEYIRIYQRIAREIKIRGNLDTSLSNRSLNDSSRPIYDPPGGRGAQD